MSKFWDGLIVIGQVIGAYLFGVAVFAGVLAVIKLLGEIIEAITK